MRRGGGAGGTYRRGRGGVGEGARRRGGVLEPDSGRRRGGLWVGDDAGMGRPGSAGPRPGRARVFF